MKSTLHSSRGPARAFTLIELLIVVAIIAILAAIAVPNFLEAQTRSKVSRVKSDMRSVATAMEAYMVDYNRYPVPSDMQANLIPDPVAAVTVSPFEGRLPVRLTTPVSYITSLPVDPFATVRAFESPVYHCWTYDYLMIRQQNAPTANWLVAYFRLFRDLMGGLPPPQLQYFFMSFGPDKIHNADLPHTGPTTAPHEHTPGAIYDPTNGTVSYGDIYYFGPGIGFEG